MTATITTDLLNTTTVHRKAHPKHLKALSLGLTRATALLRLIQGRSSLAH